MELNFKDTASLIAHDGNKITVLVGGETGIGKSALGQYVKEEYFPDYNLIIFDAAVRSEGDVALPWLTTINGKQVTVYAPTELFGLHLEGPSIIILDEIGKASQTVVNALMPAALERRFNTQAFHPDTIICATTNLATELLGDNLLAHQINRMMTVTMRKPRLSTDRQEPDEWLRDFAIPRGLAPSAIAFCLEYPQIFADYCEATRNNPYIHRPGEVTGQFVTPRSFWKMCSEHLPNQHKMSENAFYAGMIGLVGNACAKDFLVFLKTEAQLPPTHEVVANPHGTRLPETPVERLMMVYRLAQTVRKPTIDAVVVYVKRFEGETRALFTHILTNSTPGLIPDMMRLNLMRDNQDLRTA